MLEQQYLEILENREIVKEIIIHNYSFGDLDPKLDGITEATGNIFCPFHDNRYTPSAKMYYDEERNINVIHCFRERKTFTTYDYVVLILCRNLHIYKNPIDFLLKTMDERELMEEITLAKAVLENEDTEAYEQKIEYIENLYGKYNNVEKFIDSLYNELD